jgi:hypothetical protein
MIDSFKMVIGHPFVMLPSMSDKRIDAISEDKNGASRSQRLVDMFEDFMTDQESTKNAFKSFSQKALSLKDTKAEQWTPKDVKSLSKLADSSINQAKSKAAEMMPNNPYAVDQAQDAAIDNMSGMFHTLQPPPHITESAEFQALAKKFKPREEKKVEIPEDSNFVRSETLPPKIREDILNRQVEESVDEADKLATGKRRTKLSLDLGREPQADECLTFKQSAKELKRGKRPMTPEGVDDLAQKGLETMQSLREEIAPRWAPSQQPWLLNQADNEVYRTCLASVPKELFEHSATYQGMQQLRRGEAAFSPRAADATTQALGKKS